MDRTAWAVRRQLSAMGCDQFEIGLRHHSSGRMMNRQWSAYQIAKRLPWLKRMNAQDNDIYVRPAQRSPAALCLVLVDDVTLSTLTRMRMAGHEPALVVETSLDNYQAWLRLPQIDEDAVVTQVARYLAREYQADPNSADHRHYGRLAGFTNRKPNRRTVTGAPWVLLRHSSGKVATAAEALIEQIRRATNRRHAPFAPGDISAAIPLPRTHGPIDNAHAIFRTQLNRLAARYGAQLDHSRADWAALKTLVTMGYGKAVLTEVLLAQSPRILERKHGHLDDYIERTVAKVLRIHRR